MKKINNEILNLLTAAIKIMDKQKVPTEDRKITIWNEEKQEVEVINIPNIQKATNNKGGEKK